MSGRIVKKIQIVRLAQYTNQGGGNSKAGTGAIVGQSGSLTRRVSMRSIIPPIPPQPKEEVEECLEKIVIGGEFSTQAKLETLRGCTKINGDLIIKNFTTTTIDFTVFDCLKQITGYFNISDNVSLTTISGFTALKTVGYFHISNNVSLTTISGFTALETVVSYFFVAMNYALTTISGFTALKTVGNFFNIDFNYALTTFPANFNIDIITWGVFHNIVTY